MFLLRRMHDVSFAGNRRASEALLSLLKAVCLEFPELGESPAKAQFRKGYGRWLASFEARRQQSPQRFAIATRANQLSLELLSCGSQPLTQLDQLEGEAYPLTVFRGARAPKVSVNVPFAEDADAPQTLQSAGNVAQQLADHFWCSPAVLDATRWLEDAADTLNLSGETFVLLGAGAELAPTQLLLKAGAQVLWVDRRPPREAELVDCAGSVHYAPEGMDLLKAPERILRTIEQFTTGPVHFGLYAYAPGGAQEWRLCSVMNALVEACAKTGIDSKSISLLMSPASPCKVSDRDAERSLARARHARSWDRLLGKNGHISQVCDNAVSAQGMSYQAAQYVGKRLAGEAWGSLLADSSRLSVNVAGISRTKSVEHPVFGAAFLGAPKVGVRIFDANFTQQFNGLLTLYDLFGPSKSLQHCLAQHVHGGAFNLPGSLDRAIRIAALVGLGKQPGLIPQLLR